MQTNKLSDFAIRNAKPGETTYIMADGEGMFLEIAPSGGKWWRFKYRFGGKHKRMSLGTYPAIGLKEAREKRRQARELLANGESPRYLLPTAVLDDIMDAGVYMTCESHPATAANLNYI